MRRHLTIKSSFRGASETSKRGIHNHDREYGFRACAKRAHPGMTKIEISLLRRRLHHRLALRQCGDGGCPDRALLGVQKAFPDRDPLSIAVIDHLDAPPLLHRPPLPLKLDI